MASPRTLFESLMLTEFTQKRHVNACATSSHRSHVGKTKQSQTRLGLKLPGYMPASLRDYDDPDRSATWKRTLLEIGTPVGRIIRGEGLC